MMDNELAAIVISLQQQIIELQEQLLDTQDDLTAMRAQCLTYFSIAADAQSANYEFSGIIDRIRQEGDNTVFLVESASKRNRYTWPTKQFEKRNIANGCEVVVTANVSRIITIHKFHHEDGIMCCLPVLTIRKI